MKFLLFVFIFLFTLSFTSGGMSGVFASESEKSNKGSDVLKKRIDFGDSYITGQSIKSGAVYLLQRKPSEIKSMLSLRESYRNEILDDFSVKESVSLSRKDAYLKPGIGRK